MNKLVKTIIKIFKKVCQILHIIKFNEKILKDIHEEFIDSEESSSHEL
jgi:hypothetical protein